MDFESSLSTDSGKELPELSTRFAVGCKKRVINEKNNVHGPAWINNNSELGD